MLLATAVWGMRGMISGDTINWANSKSWRGHDDCSGRERMKSDLRRILGVNVQVSSVRDAIYELDRRIALRKPTRVAFLNAHLANLAFENVTLRESLDSFLVFNDGLGVDLASYILYRKKFPSNLNGSDFIPNFLNDTGHALRIALVGGRREVIDSVIKNLEHRWPRHRIVAAHHGYFRDEEEKSIARRIKDAAADVVLVAMGNPKQEEWIQRNVPTSCCVGLGVGAFFDFFSGSVPRAPLFIRRTRMEWLYRLVIEPRRLWRRYTIDNILFMSRILRQYIMNDMILK